MSYLSRDIEQNVIVHIHIFRDKFSQCPSLSHDMSQGVKDNVKLREGLQNFFETVTLPSMFASLALWTAETFISRYFGR